MHRDKNLYQILVIEDNLGDYALVEEYLQEHIRNPELAYATSFGDGLKALEAQDYRFDVLLLDLSLPDIPKDKLIEAAEQIGKRLPVIIFTGYADLNFAIKAMSTGISDYLSKDTMTSLVLYKSILYAMERHRYYRSLRESEHRYMELFCLSPAPMWVYDLESMAFLDVNGAAMQLYGYGKDEFLGMTVHDILEEPKGGALSGPRIAETEPDDMAAAAMGGRDVVHRKKDQSRIVVEVSHTDFEYKGIAAGIMLATDVTEKRQYLQAIKEQNNRLKEIAWMQSHIVRAPVARLMAIVDLMRNDDLDALGRRSLQDHIFTSAAELDEIIKKIVTNADSAINFIQ